MPRLVPTAEDEGSGCCGRAACQPPRADGGDQPWPTCGLWTWSPAVASGLNIGLLCCEACVCRPGQGETLCFCPLGFLLAAAPAIAGCVEYAQWRYISGQSVGKLIESSRQSQFTVRGTHHLPDINQALQASGSSSSYRSICCHAFLRRLSPREPGWARNERQRLLGRSWAEAMASLHIGTR